MRRLTWAGCMLVFVFLAPQAVAQYQSCVYCDVVALTPDPFPVQQCQTLTITIKGDGYQAPTVNGCDLVPVVEVRSRRPDRVVILAFRVLDDDTIEADIEIPCDAPPGLAGIDVLIDDYTGDAIPAYACGNLRLEVFPVQTCTYCDVMTFEPDPVQVKPCGTQTVIINGAGFEDPSVNNCAVPPVLDIVSSDPANVTVISFNVLDDGTIEVVIDVDCNAAPGGVTLQVVVDDDPNDGVDGLVCGEVGVDIRPPQSCTFCDVIRLDPSPLVMKPCETATITIDGSGFLDPSVNNCMFVPTVVVRSLRPDRAIVLDFRVLADGTIEVDIEIPCDATPGGVRLEILIDDDPNDDTDPLECGDVMVEVDSIPTAIRLISFSAIKNRDSMEIRWQTGAEKGSLYFDIYRVRRGARLPYKVNSRPVLSKGDVAQGADYMVTDSFDPEQDSVLYYLVETERTGRKNRYGPAVYRAQSRTPKRSLNRLR